MVAKNTHPAKSLGYLLGPGSWADRIEAYELETPRALGAGQGG